jgi:hypothetical protein
MNKAIFFAFAMLLLFGCVQNNGEQIFSLGKNLVVQGGGSYLSDNGRFAITDVNVTDSRCPAGVVCVWEGELGVTFNAYLLPSSIPTDHAQIVLGERTAKNKTALGYFFQLVSVDSITKTATIIVSKYPEPPCCSGNETLSVKDVVENADSLAGSTVKVEGIIGQKVCTKIACQPGMLCCNTCYSTLIDSKNPSYSIKINGKDCAFQSAEDYFEGVLKNENGELSLKLLMPEDNPVACPADAKICDDGTAVGRQGPNCEFPLCPNEQKFLIREIDDPGFAIVRAVVTTSIYGDGTVVVGREQYFSGRETVEYIETKTKISKQEIDALVALINSGNFFEITEEDAAQCIADPPSKTLEISLDGKYNKVTGIGLQCTPEKVSAAQQILDKIETTLNSVNCPPGYTYTPVPGLTNEPQYYCKINKGWSEFSSCSGNQECTNGYTCVSQIDSNSDFRCIPSSSYQMDCGCSPGPNNEPMCWCT